MRNGKTFEGKFQPRVQRSSLKTVILETGKGNDYFLKQAHASSINRLIDWLIDGKLVRLHARFRKTSHLGCFLPLWGASFCFASGIHIYTVHTFWPGNFWSIAGDIFGGQICKERKIHRKKFPMRKFIKEFVFFIKKGINRAQWAHKI